MKRLFTLLIGLIAIVGTVGATTVKLKGSWDKWAVHEMTNSENTLYTFTVNLTESSTYEFGVDVDGSFYKNNGIMTWDNCTGWSFSTSANNCQISTGDTGDYIFTWDTSDNKLTVSYPNSRTIYFCNNLENWTQPYAYILGAAYWDSSKGSGSSGRYYGVKMSQIDDTNIWKAEFPSTISSEYIAFLKNEQNNFGNFYQTEVVYRDGYSTSAPLFVPSTTKSGTFNGTTTYYSDGVKSTGEWHAYPTYTRSGLTEGNFGTICLPFAATVEGATVFKIVSTVGSGDSMTGINLESVDNLEAGKAYIFKATGTELTATYSGSYTDASAGYGMMGNLSSTPATVADGNYIVYGNQLRKVAGATVTVGQYRGYITLAGIGEASARSANFIAFEDDQATTIDNLTISQFDKTAPMYNLAGQRVGENYKGIVVKNGKKYINK